jgi:hypothetical protein
LDHLMGILGATTLVRGVYRALLADGRTYAGFEPRHMKWVERLTLRGDILDPMAGYGGLMRYCRASNHLLASYNVECNPPSYLWMVVTHPGKAEPLLALCDRLLACRGKWPQQRLRVVAGESWYPDQSLSMLQSLWHLTHGICVHVASPMEVEDLSLAVLLPFSGRLATCVQGNVVTHVKRGGFCVYRGWRDDFVTYLEALREELAVARESRSRKHTIRLGDACRIDLGQRRFAAMLTSPPYPNGRDYAKVFAPENDLLRRLSEMKLISKRCTLTGRLIGSSDVSEDGTLPDAQTVHSKAANNFLRFIRQYDKTATAAYDNEVYYYPYFRNYFAGLERAYENIANFLAKDFLGYLIVTNNTARKRIIPVANFLLETWRRLGFQARIVDTLEVSHVGGINPRVKGLSARHAEYIVEVSRK